MVQKVLLIIFGAVWAMVVGISAWRTGAVSPELWTVLPAGIGAILVAFRAGPAPPDPPRKRKPETTK